MRFPLTRGKPLGSPRQAPATSKWAALPAAGTWKDEKEILTLPQDRKSKALSWLSRISYGILTYMNIHAHTYILLISSHSTFSSTTPALTRLLPSTGHWAVGATLDLLYFKPEPLLASTSVNWLPASTAINLITNLLMAPVQSQTCSHVPLESAKYIHSKRLRALYEAEILQYIKWPVRSTRS